MGRKRLARWYGPANRRRGELIDKKHRGGGLTPAEAAELALLQRRCLDEVDRVHPRPDSDVLGARLRVIERRLAKERGN